MIQFSHLPNEIHLLIQTYLDKRGAASYFLSCSGHCRSLTNNNLAWQKIFPEISFPKKIKSKTYLDLQKVMTMHEVLERIDLFAKNLLIGQRGTFECIFPFIRESCLKISLKIDFFLKQNKALLRNRKLPRTSNSITYIFMNRTTHLFQHEVKHEKEPYISDKSLSVVLFTCHQIDLCLPHEFMIYEQIKKIIQKVLEEKATKLNSSIKMKPLKRVTL